jgi:hypothetical protein
MKRVNKKKCLPTPLFENVEPLDIVVVVVVVVSKNDVALKSIVTS